MARLANLATLVAFLFGADRAALLIPAAAGLAVFWIGRNEAQRGWVAAGLAYAAAAAIAPGLLRGHEPAGLAALGFVISVVWSTDIFAYFAGRTFGGPKLMPAVSPKKTISGALGGLAAGVLFGTAFHFWIMGEFRAAIVLLAAVLSVLGQGGDLFESWVKRRFGVKDSGRIIPGHGGLMDRVLSYIEAIGQAGRRWRADRHALTGRWRSANVAGKARITSSWISQRVCPGSGTRRSSRSSRSSSS